MISAFVFGLISSLHCIGMCGPIALMLPVTKEHVAKRNGQILMYHLGRITTYSTLGLVFGLLGKGFFLAGLQQQLSIGVGILMLVYAFVPQSKWGVLHFLKPFARLFDKPKKAMGKHFKSKRMLSFYWIGIFNGLLPCGIVYVALFGALATQNIGTGAFYMFLFGLGTVPLMSALVYVQAYFSVRFRQRILQVYPYIIALFGMWFILRGLGLDIPFLSPHTLKLFVQPDVQC